jgi:Holliday junction DNA helicase RuvB
MIERNDPVQDPREEALEPEEQLFEEKLRPSKFSEYVGQEQIKSSLGLAIAASLKRGEALDHVLLYGPPGLGKTTLAHVIANEMGKSVKVTSGPAIERAGDLASILTNMAEGDILFIDEIHRLPRTVEEVLYPAMEDYALDIMLGKGPSAQSLRLDLPRFTIIGATTRFGVLSGPLRDRFGLINRLEYYEPDEITRILSRSARLMDIKASEDVLATMATRSRLTPRIANRLIRRVRDYAQVHGDGSINTEALTSTLKLLDIDEFGLDRSDRRILETIMRHYKGGPVGVAAIAAASGEEPLTIEDVYEPYLIQIGFLERTHRGRRVTEKAYLHLGIEPPPEPQAKLL